MILLFAFFVCTVLMSTSVTVSELESQSQSQSESNPWDSLRLFDQEVYQHCIEKKADKWSECNSLDDMTFCAERLNGLVSFDELGVVSKGICREFGNPFLDGRAMG